VSYVKNTHLECERVLATLQRLITRKLENSSHSIANNSSQSELIARVRHYLFLLRLGDSSGIKFWMPYTLVFKLDPARGDVCAEHLKFNPLFKHWDKCNDCYLNYHKNELCLSVHQGLHNIVALARNLSDPQYRAYVLGLQFAYSAEVMQLLISGAADPKVRELYLYARHIALTAIQELRNLPEPEIKHQQMLSNFYNFCIGPAHSAKVNPNINARL